MSMGASLDASSRTDDSDIKKSQGLLRKLNSWLKKCLMPMTVIPSESYKSSASDRRQKRQEGLASFIMEGACLLEIRKES